MRSAVEASMRDKGSRVWALDDVSKQTSFSIEVLEEFTILTEKEYVQIMKQPPRAREPKQPRITVLGVTCSLRQCGSSRSRIQWAGSCC